MSIEVDVFPPAHPDTPAAVEHTMAGRCVRIRLKRDGQPFAAYLTLAEARTLAEQLVEKAVT